MVAACWPEAEQSVLANYAEVAQMLTVSAPAENTAFVPKAAAAAEVWDETIAAYVQMTSAVAVAARSVVLCRELSEPRQLASHGPDGHAC